TNTPHRDQQRPTRGAAPAVAREASAWPCRCPSRDRPSVNRPTPPRGVGSRPKPAPARSSRRLLARPGPRFVCASVYILAVRYSRNHDTARAQASVAAALSYRGPVSLKKAWFAPLYTLKSCGTPAVSSAAITAAALPVMPVSNSPYIPSAAALVCASTSSGG